MIIAFRLVEYLYDASNIFMVSKETVQEFDIQELIWSFIFKNANVNKVVIEKFINDLNLSFRNLYFHQSWVLHIINLIVKDVLEHISEKLDKNTQAINFITVSPSRKQAFNSSCVEHGLEERSFVIDVTHRLNCTYLMLWWCEKQDKIILLYYNGRHTDGPRT